MAKEKDRCTRFHRKHKPRRAKVISGGPGEGVWVEYPTLIDEIYDCDVIACERCHRVWPLKERSDA